MFINTQLAEEISREIKNIIPYYFNIMDDTGLILTCTDSERVGTKHEGTYLMVKNKWDELIVERENQYIGCTMGVLFTLRFAGKVIGFIGIKGEPNEIIAYGRILQKMTELLVYEKFESHRQEANENARFILIDNLINGKASSLVFNVREGLIKNGLNYAEMFTVGILKYQMIPALAFDVDIEEAKQKIMKRQIVTTLAQKGILAANDKEQCIMVSNYDTETLLEILRKLERHIEEQYKMTMIGAISDQFSVDEIPRAYGETSAMVQFLYEEDMRGISRYNPAHLPFIAQQLSISHKENLFREVFGSCTNEEVYDFINFIKAYIECNGSLKELAETYYLHKNTIQYKIKKIQKKTGLDMRIMKELFVLYIATTRK